jgi:hypothetical protein
LQPRRCLGRADAILPVGHQTNAGGIAPKAISGKGIHLEKWNRHSAKLLPFLL